MRLGTVPCLSFLQPTTYEMPSRLLPPWRVTPPHPPAHSFFLVSLEIQPSSYCMVAATSPCPFTFTSMPLPPSSVLPSKSFLPSRWWPVHPCAIPMQIQAQAALLSPPSLSRSRVHATVRVRHAPPGCHTTICGCLPPARFDTFGTPRKMCSACTPLQPGCAPNCSVLPTQI